ncbi:hypothetical protein JCM33774_48210 [Actinophytocola sp. KF-1]
MSGWEVHPLARDLRHRMSRGGFGKARTGGGLAEVCAEWRAKAVGWRRRVTGPGGEGRMATASGVGEGRAARRGRIGGRARQRGGPGEGETRRGASEDGRRRGSGENGWPTRNG